MTIIGVDPAFRENGLGFCIFEPYGKILTFVKIDDVYHFDKVLRDIKNTYNGVYLAIENSNLQSAIFGGKNKKESLQVFAKRCQDVGKNKAVSQIISNQSRFLLGDENVKDFSPLKKGDKDDASKFKRRLLKYDIATVSYLNKKNTTNEDQRDAFKVASLYYDELKLLERVRMNK